VPSVLTDGTTVLPVTHSGTDDHFARPDGYVGNGWSDAHTLYPALFNPAVIIAGKLNATGSTDSTWNEPPELPWEVGHTLIYRECPWSNFQITVRWSTDDPLAVLSQISPALFVNVDAADPLAVGVKPVFDVGLSNSTYWQNCFRTATDMADVLDPEAYYRDIDGTGMSGTGLFGPTGPGTTQEITCRHVDGFMRWWWNGNPRDTAPVAVPAYVQDGRPLMVGIDVISIHARVGEAWGTTPPASLIIPDRIVQDEIVYFSMQPYTGTL
jgi:hypothetical protein